MSRTIKSLNIAVIIACLAAYVPLDLEPPLRASAPNPPATETSDLSQSRLTASPVPIALSAPAQPVVSRNAPASPAAERTAPTEAAFDSAFTRNLRTGSDQRQLLISDVPLNYQDEDGLWQPIDPRFELQGNRFANTHNALQIDASATRGAFRAQQGRAQVGWDPREIVLTNADGETILAQPLATEQTLTGTLSPDGRAIRYPHGWTLDTLSEEVLSGPGSVEHSLSFERRPQALDSSADQSPTSTLSLRASLQLLPDYGLRANGRVYTDAFTTDGELQIVNIAEQVVLTLPPARAFEQARPSVGIAAHYHAWPQSDGEWTIAVETPAAWWADPLRQYPVALDPIIEVLRPIDYATIRPGLGGTDRDRVEVGNDLVGGIRALIRFRNFPTLPPGYVIQKAELAAVANFGFFPTVNGTEQFAQTTVNLFRPTQGWDPNLVTWNTQPDIDLNPIDGSRLVQVPPYSYLVQNKDAYQLTGPYTAIKWTLPNNVVRDWLTGGANAGLELRSTVESACSAYDLSTCHSVGFIAPQNGWVQRDLADIVTYGKTSGGGLMLIVTYQAPQLQDGVPYNYNLLPRPPSPDGISYYRSFHAYSLPPNNGNTWTAVAVKGLMDAAPAQTPTGTYTFKGWFSYGNDGTSFYKQDQALLPEHPKAAPMPIGGCRSDSSLASLSCLNPDDGISSGEGSNTGSNYVLLSAPAAANHEARVYPTTNDPRLKYYAVEAVRAKPLPALNLTQVFSTGYLFTQTFSISTTQIITAYSVDLPANTRVGIKLSAGIPSLNPRVEARLFGPGNGTYGKTQSVVTIPNNTRQRYTINPGQQGNYALVLEYASDVTVFNPDHGATITPSISTLSGRISVLVCPIEAIPTEDGCQFMFKPHDIGQPNGTAYRDVGPYRIYSEGNFDPCNTTDECTHKSSGGRLYTPFVGWGSDLSRLVVVAGQPIQVNTAAQHVNLIYPSGDEGPIVLLGIDPPGYITRTFEAWVGTATGHPVFGDTAYPFLTKDSTCSTSSCASLLTPLLPKDVKSSHVKINVQNSVGSPQYAQADTTLYRPIQIAMGSVQTATFTLDWKVHAEGYAGRPSYSADGPFDISLTLASGPPTMDVASMTYYMGTAWSMDYDPTSGTVMFTNIRNQGKITQDDKLGGAWKFVQFVIPKYQEMSGQGVGNGTCFGGYCNEVRAPEDTLYDAHRFWRMPDVKVEGNAKTVMLSRPGELQVFSSDYPGQGPYRNSPSLANTVLISQPFSFNGMNGTVKVEYAVCPDSANTDQVLVVRGNAKMAMPGIGSTEDATAMISTTFTLCELALREAGLYFHAEPGIPVGATGVNITGLKGLVKVGPDFTVVTVGVDFTVAKLVDAQVEVTVDTRGLFDIQGHGRIIALVDFVGHSWVAWNPLDVGVDLGIYFPKFKDKDGNEVWWIRGQIHGHVWKGQGWQHKYKWLPDNDDMHYAASILAEIKIKKGACCDIFGVPIPPFEVRYGVEVAFGQFCINAQCTQYEDGIKGQVFILSFNIGVYYGFSTGFSFILGSDGHILIDQYQPKSAQALYYGSERTSSEPTVNGQPFAFNRQAVGDPNAPSVTVPLTVTPSTGSFMVGLTWARNAPTLTLMQPGSSVEISPSNALTYGVQYTGTDYYILYMVGSPAPGIWHGKISNATPSDDYHLLFFANKKLPTVTFVSPSANQTLSNTLDSTQPFTYHVQWAASVTGSLKISLYYSATNAGALTTTQPYGGVIREDMPLSQGTFDWDMSFLGKGQYRLYAKVSDGPDVRPSVTGTNQTPGVLWVNAPGVLTYNDPTPPPAPTNLTLTPLDDAALACWDANPAHDVAGYLLNYNAPDVNGIYKPRALRVIATVPYTPTAVPARQCTRIGGLNSGGLVQAALAAYDATGNLSGSTLSSVDIAPNSPDSAPAAGVLTGSVNSSYVVSLSWTGAPAGSSIAGYELFYADAFPAGPGRPGSGANQGNSPVRLGNVLATTLTGLTHGRTFHFRVRAIDTESRVGPLSNDVALLLTNGVSTGGDGLPDDWKAAHHVTHATADDDCDGLTNAEEFIRRTEPDVADTDGDGYTDGEEVTFGSDPLDRGVLPVNLAHLPRVGLSDERLSFRTYVSTTAPAPQSVNITNWSGGLLTPTLGTVSPWLNATLNSNTLQVGMNKTGLAAGHYGGTVEVKATGSRIIGCSAKLTVNLWLMGGVPPVGFYRVFLPIAVK